MDDHEADMESVELRLASLSDRLSERSRRVEDLESETEFLVAKLAHQAAIFEEKLSALNHENEVMAAVQVAQLNDLRAELQAIRNTWSWRVTRPLRLVQERRMRGRSEAAPD